MNNIFSEEVNCLGQVEIWGKKIIKVSKSLHDVIAYAAVYSKEEAI